MTVAVAAGEVGRALRWDRVEAEYVDPGRGRERARLAVCWPLRFERMSPVPGFASFRGQRNWPGWWWFSRTGEHVGHESWLGRDVHGRLLARDQWQAPADRQARDDGRPLTSGRPGPSPRVRFPLGDAGQDGTARDADGPLPDNPDSLSAAGLGVALNRPRLLVGGHLADPLAGARPRRS